MSLESVLIKFPTKCPQCSGINLWSAIDTMINVRHVSKGWLIKELNTIEPKQTIYCDDCEHEWRTP